MDLMVDTIRFVPCAHRRVTYAEHVRRATLEWRPDVIAVELPATLEPWILRGVARLPQISAVCWEESERPGQLSYLPIDPCDSMTEAVRLAHENDIPLALIDLDLPGLQERSRYMPDDLIIDKVGLEEFVASVSPYVSSAEEDWRELARECHMARRLRELAEGGTKKVLCVLGMAHYLRVREMVEEGGRIANPFELAPDALRERRGAFLAHVTRSSLVDVLGEIPYLTYLFEQSREELEITGQAAFDKLGAVQTLLRRASDEYTKTYKETINLTQWKSLLQFTRNLAMVRGRLRPDLYEVVIGARGIVDGDYGFEVFELASSYPPQDENSDLPRFKIRHGRGMIEGREGVFRLLPRHEEPPFETVKIGFRRRPPKFMMEHWKDQWEHSFHFGICSWPPEDDIQERFMDYVRKRALQIVTEDRRQVEEFQTSLLDGLDIRETTRNWHTGKLYVQSTPQPQGRVGAVVVILRDTPLEDAEYSWRATLFAENQNESDITFFALPLGSKVVGPRICRTEFGGILSVYPAWGIPDIWRFQLGEGIDTCADALLAAGILFSPDRYLAYVAQHPPRAQLKEMAALYHKHIIYMPLHMFSPAHLKRIRRFHILDGHDVRAWARDYIFED